MFCGGQDHGCKCHPRHRPYLTNDGNKQVGKDKIANKDKHDDEDAVHRVSQGVQFSLTISPTISLAVRGQGMM